jgi:NAD(P)H dehydrogenase (quinone)
LNRTTTGGSPYGASHLATHGVIGPRLSDDERELAQLLGRRLAELTAAATALRDG